MDMTPKTFIQAILIGSLLICVRGSWPALTLVYRAIIDPILDTLFGPRVEEIECSCTPMYGPNWDSEN